MNAESATAPESGEAWLQVSFSPHLTSWMAMHEVSLACTTYQTGKLLLFGRKPDGDLSIFERTFNRCMGLWASDDGRTLWMSSLFQLWRFEDALKPFETHEGYDRFYVPRFGYTTGNLDIHDIVVESTGRVVFVATGFGCLATISDRASFSPIWKPSYLSKLTAEDRCHLNGVALDEGKCRYAAAVSMTDFPDGWRDRRRDGGVMLEVPTGRVVVDGLSMPHSPRVYRGELWLLDAGTGYLGKVKDGRFERVAFCPGFLRGLAFVGDFAVVGMSMPRHDKTFAGLALDEELSRRGTESRCGLAVIDLRTGDVIHWLRLEGPIRELYDVVVLRGVTRPKALGFQTNEIQRVISLGDSQPP